jgi:tyrosinase
MATPTPRPNIETLQQKPADLAVFRDAYDKMQALAGTDNRSWIHWAGLHGYPQWQCWHHYKLGQQNTQRTYNLFLPWHRAYLTYWEHAMRDQNADAVLPWWDWTSATSHQVGLPQSFSVPAVGANRNSLLDGPVPAILGNPPRVTQRFPGSPSSLPTPTDINSLLELTSFVDFSDQLEDYHDQIHGWTGGRDPNNPGNGGDMGSVAVAAFEPIFWSHHCMIDRVWYLWQLKQGINNIPDDYLDKPLAPFSFVVRDVLDINNLGYEYVDSRTDSGGGQ